MSTCQSPASATASARRSAQEKRELADTPEAELTELTALYEAKGLSAATARTVAAELTARGALAAHLDAELHIDPDDIPSPVQAAAASALSFTSGALLPMLAILLPPAELRVPVTFAAVLIALGLTGALSARLGGSNVRRAVLRVVIGGALGLAFTYGVGHLFGTAIGLPGAGAGCRLSERRGHHGMTIDGSCDRARHRDLRAVPP